MLPKGLIPASTAAFVTTVAAVTLLIATGHDPTSLIAFLASVPTTITSVWLVVRTGKVEGKIDSAAATLGTVSRNVNGHLDRLSDAAGLPAKPTTPGEAT